MFESSTKREIRQFHVVIVQVTARKTHKACQSKPIPFLPFSLLSSSLLVPERPISDNRIKILFHFLHLPFYALSNILCYHKYISE